MISHACISAEGQHQPWLQPERSVRVVHFRKCAQGKRCGARAPHVARQPQVHSIRQDHQHVTPLSANKITTTFSPLKMAAIYALPSDVPPFNSQIRWPPSLLGSTYTGLAVLRSRQGRDFAMPVLMDRSRVDQHPSDLSAEFFVTRRATGASEQVDRRVDHAGQCDRGEALFGFDLRDEP